MMPCMTTEFMRVRSLVRGRRLVSSGCFREDRPAPTLCRPAVAGKVLMRRGFLLAAASPTMSLSSSTASAAAASGRPVPVHVDFVSDTM